MFDKLCPTSIVNSSTETLSLNEITSSQALILNNTIPPYDPASCKLASNFESKSTRLAAPVSWSKKVCVRIKVSKRLRSWRESLNSSINLSNASLAVKSTLADHLWQILVFCLLRSFALFLLTVQSHIAALSAT